MPAAGVEAGQVVPADGVEPPRESFALALGEHAGEGPDVTGQGIESGAVDDDSTTVGEPAAAAHRTVVGIADANGRERSGRRRRNR